MNKTEWIVAIGLGGFLLIAVAGTVNIVLSMFPTPPVRSASSPPGKARSGLWWNLA